MFLKIYSSVTSNEGINTTWGTLIRCCNYSWNIFPECKLLFTPVLMCGDQDSNMRDLLGPRFLIQSGCTYDKVEYRSAVLPGCPISANSVFTYPVALGCHCGACRTDSDECAHRASVHGARCTKPVRHIYPNPDNYMIPFWIRFFSSCLFMKLNDPWMFWDVFLAMDTVTCVCTVSIVPAMFYCVCCSSASLLTAGVDPGMYLSQGPFLSSSTITCVWLPDLLCILWKRSSNYNPIKAYISK